MMIGKYGHRALWKQIGVASKVVKLPWLDIGILSLFWYSSTIES